MSRRRSPQEKKFLSYQKDRRNNYGENDKSSRKNIARNKRRQARVPRRRAAEALAVTRGGLDADSCAEAQERIEGRRPTERWVWSKWRDATLAQDVLWKLGARVRAQGREGADARRLERIRRVHARVCHRDPAE
ncbi:hypothetical protein [Nocardiopsis ganjiahuensis]|uniref:hypothetical protein n=1 Tax=Nocardiopsis ganjiahuensis TaxID=239984 RepID=UPI000346359C|nr:hypothetical protein [Nocardiopsis ganjiahuensis]